MDSPDMRSNDALSNDTPESMGSSTAGHNMASPLGQQNADENPHQIIMKTDMPRTIDKMMESCANDPDNKDRPALSYAWEGNHYVDYTFTRLRSFIIKAANSYSSMVPRRTSSDDRVLVTALLGLSTLDYLIAQLSLSNLGHTPLMLSPRLSLEAHLSLLERCRATVLFVDSSQSRMGAKIQDALPGLRVHPLLGKEAYTSPTPGVLPPSNLDPDREQHNTAWIIHSSGSTGLPRPVAMTHSGAISNYFSPVRVPSLVTPPLFHAAGLATVFRSMANRQQTYLLNGATPLTASLVASTLRAHPHIRALHAVPFALKLLAEDPSHLSLLASLDLVIYSGAHLSAEVGDRLASSGVLAVALYASTETGQVMNSFRPRSAAGDWAWMRAVPAAAPFLRFEPCDDVAGVFELVVAEGWGAKNASNRPDGAWATGDLFERHPDWPRVEGWRYHARRDDTIVLGNGEKANPLLLEGAAVGSGSAREAVVFGAGKEALGMFVVPADRASGEEEVRGAVWEAVRAVNERMPGHARLARDMIRLFPEGLEGRIRRTDKSNVIRPAFYEEFRELIDEVYEEGKPRGRLVLDETQLQEYLKKLVERFVDDERQGSLRYDTDLFALGVDSLRASQLRAAISRDIDIGDDPLGLNFVFEFPSIRAMVRELDRLRRGDAAASRGTDEELMQELIQKYSRFESIRASEEPLNSTEETLLITGATGSLGAHLVARLATHPKVARTICLVRANNDADALERLETSLKHRKLDLDVRCAKCQVEVYATKDLSLPFLGLVDESVYHQIANSVTKIIHCGWTVNFNMGLESFEECIAGTAALLTICTSRHSGSHPGFIFCSSISTFGNSSISEIPESLPPSLHDALPTGYAKSKLVSEHICLNAAKLANVDVRVVRIGQIVGDTQHGVWNTHEAQTMILRSAQTIGVLPESKEHCSWLPVDTTAASVIEIALSPEAVTGVYHVVNPRSFSWSEDLLPILPSAGLDFTVVTPREWLTALEKKPDLKKNPPYKLIEYYHNKYGIPGSAEQKVFLSDKAQAVSPVLRSATAPDQRLIGRIVRYLKEQWAAEDDL